MRDRLPRAPDMPLRAPAGGKAIAKSLEKNHRLRTLEMRGNAIGDEGAVAFADMMPKNVPLSTLDSSRLNGLSSAVSFWRSASSFS